MLFCRQGFSNQPVNSSSDLCCSVNKFFFLNIEFCQHVGANYGGHALCLCWAIPV